MVRLEIHAKADGIRWRLANGDRVKRPMTRVAELR
jgi:hypothetical protein